MQNMSGGKTALGLDANVGALLCYLPVCLVSLIFSIIVIIADKENRFVRFHAFQSLLLSAIYIVLVIAINILGGIIGAVISGTLGSLFSLLTLVVVVGFIAAMVYGCIKGFQGQMFKFPVIGDMAEKWS
ncbi:MAG: DUF4870 domain-containing protein [Pyrinomonadaceae bacterium]|jgi:uncharacterized membrane protein